MRLTRADRPVPLPVQALDHATGWLMAAAAVAGLRDRLRDGRGSIARLSLARTAVELLSGEPEAAALTTLPSSGIDTPWGPADVLDPPVDVPGARLRFDTGPGDLGSAPASWPA